MIQVRLTQEKTSSSSQAHKLRRDADATLSPRRRSAQEGGSLDSAQEGDPPQNLSKDETYKLGPIRKPSTKACYSFPSPTRGRKVSSRSRIPHPKRTPCEARVITKEQSPLTQRLVAQEMDTGDSWGRSEAVWRNKALGPDGYSSGFFKAAWLIVGDEVTRAVLDFFNTGKLLKQVNYTLRAVIPMVHSPITVADFRLIFCCNVLYKVIAKLLVQRLSVVLGKLVSPCQAAFIPGRIIKDNIMIAQELFTGYKQRRLPPRCALKADIRKAYVTVEWNFLDATLQLFGFLVTFMRWIEECITTPTFSVSLNGKPHDFFVGARGLRQGDPLSPYLFVLVMKVMHLVFLQKIDQDGRFQFHWKCEESKIFQLGFADDVLLFSRAKVDSVRIFKDGLERFGDWSGLRLNAQKSHLILSRATQGLKEKLLTMLQF
ncbi:UNVERIFIED_CONTAM: hypothetical protein Sindi_2150600 [Sesamum indicum]